MVVLLGRAEPARAERPEDRLRDVAPASVPARPPPRNFMAQETLVQLSSPAAVIMEPTAGTPLPAQVVHPHQILARRRHPWIATLAAGGATLLSGAVLGGLALGQAAQFHRDVEAGSPREELEALASSTRQLAFSSDMLLGTTALFGLITLVLRFGTATGSTPAPPDLEPAYQVP
jgi:hypothetical protein